MISIPVILLFCVGLWGILSGATLIRKIIALSILNSSLVVLFVLGGLLDGETAPILTALQTGKIVDPIPQALMLTAIVVGLSITAVALILSIRIYRNFGTVDIKEIEKQADESDF